MTATPSAHLQRRSPLIPGARRFYLVLAGLFAVGIVLQVFFAGLGVLVNPSYFGWHTTFAHLLELILLVMPVVGFFGRVGWQSFGLNGLLFVLFGMQYFFMYGLQGPLRALHVVNALALFWLAIQLGQQSWRLTRTTRATRDEGASIRGEKTPVGRSVAGGIAILLGAVVLFGVIFDNGPGFIGSGSAPPQGAPPDVDAGATTNTSVAGDQLYAQNCAGCHGQTGTGGFGPALAGNEALADNLDTVEQILDGGGGMPAWRDRLSDEEVAAVATHVRTNWSNNFGAVSVEEVESQR